MVKENYTFNGLSFGGDYGIAKEQNILETKRQKLARDYIDAIINADDKQEQEKQIDVTLQNPEVLSSMSSNNLMYFLTSLRKMKRFNKIIELYENSNNDIFKNSLMVKEQILLAYNKTNQPDLTIAMGKSMSDNREISGDVCGAVGKAYLLKAKSASSIEEKFLYTKKSAEFYEYGFKVFGEFYPGINATYRYLELGQKQKAEELAKIVYLATLKEGANETKDYWCATTRLESACIAKLPEEEIEKSLNYVLNMNTEVWCWETTIQTLQGVNENLKSPQIGRVISSLQERVTSNTKGSHSGNYEDKKYEAIINSSYSYRGLASNFEGSSSVGGNMRFGGQLPDHSISRKDLEFFDQILATPLIDLFPQGKFEELYSKEISEHKFDAETALKDIIQMDEFLSATDKFIRYHFGTDNFAGTGLKLEDNAEINNSIYDQSVSAMLELSGKKSDRQSDSRTNISALFIMGVGDCRHHAQVKQILFDRWQDKQMDEVIHQMYENGTTQELQDKFYDIYNTELRTIDVNVNLPIELNGMYAPIKDENGKYIVQDEPQTTPLEEHTMNILIKKDKDNHLVEACIADSFYQNHYDWSHHQIDLENDFKLNQKGEYSINVGKLDSERVQGGQEIDINIEPTVYAGKRDNYNSDEHGNNIRLIGLPMNINNYDEMLKVLQNRQGMNKMLNNMREWDNNKKLILDKNDELQK